MTLFLTYCVGHDVRKVEKKIFYMVRSIALATVPDAVILSVAYQGEGLRVIQPSP